MLPERRTKPVCAFEIRRYACLDPNGRAAGDLPATVQDREFVVSLYRALVLTRTFDEKAIALQRTGQLGPA